MFNSARLNSRLFAAALGALAMGTFAVSGSAVAAPLQLFPFLMTPPAQSAPPVQAAPSDDDEGTVREMPARLKRQVVNYASREAPGTIIIVSANSSNQMTRARFAGSAGIITGSGCFASR